MSTERQRLPPSVYSPLVPERGPVPHNNVSETLPTDGLSPSSRRPMPNQSRGIDNAIRPSSVPPQSRRARIEPMVNLVDLGAVLVSLLTLALAVMTISPSLPYAARLQYADQIIIIGFLLAVMNQAMQRVLPFFLPASRTAVRSLSTSKL